MDYCYQSINQSPLFQATRPTQTAGKIWSKRIHRQEQHREIDERLHPVCGKNPLNFGITPHSKWPNGSRFGLSL